ncbi:MAG: hypothetical protein ACM31O_14460 [Bacteroidota bacterium]
MNPRLELHWHYRRLELEAAEREERMKREQAARKVKACAYWCGIVLGALVLAYDVTKGVW